MGCDKLGQGDHARLCALVSSPPVSRLPQALAPGGLCRPGIGSAIPPKGESTVPPHSAWVAAPLMLRTVAPAWERPCGPVLGVGARRRVGFTRRPNQVAGAPRPTRAMDDLGLAHRHRIWVDRLCSRLCQLVPGRVELACGCAAQAPLVDAQQPIVVPRWRLVRHRKTWPCRRSGRLRQRPDQHRGMANVLTITAHADARCATACAVTAAGVGVQEVATATPAGDAIPVHAGHGISLGSSPREPARGLACRSREPAQHGSVASGQPLVRRPLARRRVDGLALRDHAAPEHAVCPMRTAAATVESARCAPTTNP